MSPHRVLLGLGLTLAACVVPKPQLSAMLQFQWAAAVLFGSEAGDARSAVVRWTGPVHYLMAGVAERHRGAAQDGEGDPGAGRLGGAHWGGGGWTMSPKPPRVPAFLLERMTPRREREFLLGDLQERYRDSLAARGRAVAVGWYWIQVIKTLVSLPRGVVAWL